MHDVAQTDAVYLLQALDQATIERLMQDDALSALMGALGSQYPELIGPLIRERDVYLAWSLKRSKAVNSTNQVVGVIGAGHVRGVVWALEQDAGGDSLRFSDLVNSKNKRASKQQQQAESVARLVTELALGFVLFAAWQWARGE